ncbi:alpha-ribazole phosphatase [Anditalea andensis]|uniref:Alpha-ribazole phosphatase n=1 Tax=Anditalea andensis TaxID=1048983 RepID=A0A074KXN6_9BACT|nr:alpha-ribazole phosphatase [Anditalea andensis]KEO72975.1 hypothetical protein EL17_15260 [Anditalea andensis]
MEIYLIRHTTPDVSKGLIYGRTDVGLIETFLDEKNAILKKLPSDIEVVVSSPSTRCTELAAHINKQYKKDDRLYEVNFGSWEGKTWDTIDQKESEAWMRDFVNVCPPGGESMAQMQNRVMDFFKELLQLEIAQAAVITHGGVIRILLAHIQQIPLERSFEIKVNFSDIYKVQHHLTGEIETMQL